MSMQVPLRTVCFSLALIVLSHSSPVQSGAQDQGTSKPDSSETEKQSQALELAQQGQTFLKQKHWKQAITAFEKAVELQPQNSTLHYLLGVSYLEDSQASKAWPEVRKAVLLDQGNKNALKMFLNFWSFFDRKGILNVGTPEVEVLKLLGAPDSKREQGAETHLTYGFMWLNFQNASLYAVLDTRGLNSEYTRALQTMEFRLGPPWRVGYRMMNGTSALTEYVTPDETVQDYTQMFSTQRLFKLGKEFSARQMMARMKASLEKSHEVEEWNVIQEEDNDVIYEWRVKGSDRSPAQHEISRVVRGRRDMHRLAYVTRKLPLSEADRQKWITLLKSAKVLLAHPEVQPLSPEEKKQLEEKLTAKSREIIALQLKYIQEGNVEALKPFFTKRLRDQITKETLDQAKEQAASAKPDELVHSVTVLKAGEETQAKIKMKNGRTLTTLVPVNEKWEADTIWFK